MAMAGFATFTVIGGITHLWRRVTGQLPDSRLLTWAYWVSLVSLLAMVIDLTLVGLVQAGMWMTGEPWINSVIASNVGWQVRTWSGVMLTSGFVLVLFSLRPRTTPLENPATDALGLAAVEASGPPEALMPDINPEPNVSKVAAGDEPQPGTHRYQRFLEHVEVIIILAGLRFISSVFCDSWTRANPEPTAAGP